MFLSKTQELIITTISIIISVILLFSNHILFFILDTFFCVLFIIEWIFGLFRSENKKNYFCNNWIVLLYSVPAIPILRFGRVFRLLRLLRLLKIGMLVNKLYCSYCSKLKSDVLNTMIVYLIIVFGIGTFGFYFVEHGVNDKICNYADSAWLTFTTLTTIGYGDIYPMTLEGRIVTILISLLGLGLFASIISVISDKIKGV
jgi:voltage-gated potassium channel